MNEKRICIYIYYFIRISRLKSAKFKNVTNKPKRFQKKEILKKQTNKQTTILTPAPGVLVKGPCHENIAVLYLCLFFSFDLF